MSDYEYNKEYAKKYLNSLDEIRIRVPKGKKEEYKKAAAAAGYESLNKFIESAIEEKIKGTD